MAINQNNVKLFPTEEFHKNWPFCEALVESFFLHSRGCSSLKQFFYEAAPCDNENDSDNKTDCVYELPFRYFFIEDCAEQSLYYNRNDDDPTYTLDHIPYNTLVCEALRYYVKNSIKTNKNQSMVWVRVFRYLLDERFDVLKVLIEENFMQKLKPIIIQNFYDGFKAQENRRLQQASWQNITNDFFYKIWFSKERLLNIFLYCEFPRKDSEVLVTDFFREKNYQNILLYYKNVLFDLFQITEN